MSAAPSDLTETGMANGALAHIGEPPISSLDDPKRAAARHCKRFFAETRDEILCDKDWEFARNSCTPAAQTTSPNKHWRYRYNMPADCVAVLGIGSRGETAWESPSTGDDATVVKVLDTNATAPLVWYTRRIVNPAQWHPLFCRLFKSALAAKVNPLIGRDKSLTDSLVAGAANVEDKAAMRDAQQKSGQQISRDTTWVRSRFGYSTWPR